MPLPTPEELQQQAAEVAAAQEHLAKVQAWLEEGTRLLDPSPGPQLAGELHAPATNTPPPRPVRPKPALPARSERVTRTPKQRDTEAAVLAYLLDHQNGVTTGELEQHINTSRPVLSRVLRSLRDAGRIRSEGKTAARRHYPADREPQSEVRAKVDVAVERNATELSTNVEKIGLRDRVLKAVLANPDQLTDDKIAWAIDEHVEKVETTLTDLVVRGQLIENRDGTYGRGSRAGIAA